jgi:hypothetical protein
LKPKHYSQVTEFSDAYMTSFESLATPNRPPISATLSIQAYERQTVLEMKWSPAFPARFTSTSSLVVAQFHFCENTRLMTDSKPTQATTPWGSQLYGNPCRECDFRWELSAIEAVNLVQELPSLYVARLKGASGRETSRDLAWSISAYVSHVSDNLRIWGERLAGARLSGDYRVASYDNDLLGVARRYSEINLQAALWSLDWAVQEWSQSLLAALSAHTELQHLDRGRQSAEDVARNNAHDASHHLWDIERILGAKD